MLIPQAIVSQSASSIWEVVHDETLSSSGTFDVSGIPGTYLDLQLRILARSTRAGNNFDSALLRINNDSGTNYQAAGSQSFTSISGAEKLGGTSFTGNGLVLPYFGLLPAAVSDAGFVGYIVAEIGSYAQTTFHKPILSRWTTALDTGSGDTRDGSSGGLWKSTAAITRLAVLSGNGDSFVSGSRFTILGLRVT